MIVRLHLLMPEHQWKAHVMLFGNSYKTWQQQFREYLLTKRVDGVEMAAYSPFRWIEVGGLKWCNVIEWHEELEKEGLGRKPGNFQFRSESGVLEDARMRVYERLKEFGNVESYRE